MSKERARFNVPEVGAVRMGVVSMVQKTVARRVSFIVWKCCLEGKGCFVFDQDFRGCEVRLVLKGGMLLG